MNLKDKIQRFGFSNVKLIEGYDKAVIGFTKDEKPVYNYSTIVGIILDENPKFSVEEADVKARKLIDASGAEDFAVIVYDIF